MSSSQIEMKIVRVSCNYEYVTPTKRRNAWEIVFQNISDKKAKYVIIEANSYLPKLEVTDSMNRHLLVIPRHLIPKKILKNEYTMLIELVDPIDVEAFGCICIQSISTVAEEKRILYHKKTIGYVRYSFSPEISPVMKEECSWYIGIFAPEDFHLRMQEPTDKLEHIYRDESSFACRTFSKTAPRLDWNIEIPFRITCWIWVGLIIGIVAPLFALGLSLDMKYLTISFSIVLGTLASVIAMRAWIFQSVELLDRMNKIYVTIFVCDLIALVVLTLSCLGFWNSLLSSLFPPQIDP